MSHSRSPEIALHLQQKSIDPHHVISPNVDELSLYDNRLEKNMIINNGTEIIKTKIVQAKPARPET